MLASPTESVGLRGHVGQEIDVTLLLNERALFFGSTAELEAALEAAIYALKNLRGNHTLRQVLAQLADYGAAGVFE